jgi:CRISPR-associated protein Cas2
LPYHFIITYDVADDDRRSDISDLLASYGARVQYSAFEITLRTKKEVQKLRGRLRKLIDQDEDQVRLYPLPVTVFNETCILGNRRLEERASFWIT